jgi:CheY-like chemotaxis protein
LVVDDNAVNRRLVRAFLAPAGHRVQAVESGTQALQALTTEKIDLVLLDIQMPVMDGPECLQRIRALDAPVRDVPVVALTANAMAGDRERYLAGGFDDYVSKPFTTSTLSDAMARAIDRVHARV